MKKILVIAFILALAGCSKQAETSTQANNEFVVDKLFTHEGCTVYRFIDGGNNRYFTNCSGSTNWQEGCGKNCTRNMNIN